MPFSVILRRIWFRLHGRVVQLRPKGKPKGDVLISYTTLPFLDTRESILNGHSNRWECRQMAREFLSRGYTVDIIDFENSRFSPKKHYTYVIDLGQQLERLAPLLTTSKKIYHITSCHWKFNNEAEQARLREVQERRGVPFAPVRLMQPNNGIEYADMATSLGGPFAERTYAFAQKPITHLALPSTHTYPELKRDTDAHKRFVWFGGSGAIHKGLDLVLEAFAQMPEYELIVCGKFSGEEDFVNVYHKELYETSNITSVGYIDPGSEKFKEICSSATAVVYPSCAEGCATSVALCMHAGLIPVVSRETGIETGAFGIILPHNTVSTIQTAVKMLASLPAAELAQRSAESRRCANTNYTRAKFAHDFTQFVDGLESSHV